MHTQQVYAHKRTLFKLSLIMVFCLLLLAACAHYTFTTYHELNKEVIIPDNYQGFLVIRYDCPDGVPLPASANVITYRFRHDGTICIRDPLPNTRGQYAIRTHGGKQLVAMGDPWPTTGYGLTDAEIYTTMIVGQRMSFEVYWAGNLATHANIRDYDEQLDRFLAARFGPQ